MKKNPKISVIVSVYNTEKYLVRCLNSIINQTYKQLEIIIVEDGSSDNSKKLLKEFENIQNIKIIYNKKNMGLAYSRNIGLKHSSGDYIGYIDSDDYIDSDYYENLINKILEEQSEIAICDIKIVYEEKNIELISRCVDNEDVNLLSVVNNGLAASACNKLFKRELIEMYEFSEGKVNEDLAVVIPALCNSKKISYAKDTYYYYVQRGGSIQNSSFSDKRFDIFYGVDVTLSRINNNILYNELRECLIYNQLITLLLYVIPKEKNLIKRYKILKKYNMLSKKYNILNNKYFLEFLDKCGKRYKIYYKMLFKLNSLKLYLLSNILIVIGDIIAKIRARKPVINGDITLDTLIYAAKNQSKIKSNGPTISAVIPNYNYEKFIYQRVFSILNQDYKINELIILDDCSKDNSREIIDDLVEKLSPYIDIKKNYNDKNSGSTFKQWKKAFELSKSEYLWIAEADDYCEKNLVSSLMKLIKKDKEITVAHVDTAFIDVEGNILLKTIKPEIDLLKTKHWNNDFISDGLDEIKNYEYLNCTIANVSSAIFKKLDYMDILKEIVNYKQVGDYLFYINAMSRGKVAYVNKTLNYYRMHGDNVTSTTKKQLHLDELKKVHKYIEERFGLDENQKKNIKNRYDFLEKVWGLKK